MKASRENFVPLGLMVLVLLLTSLSVPAQIFNTIHTFSALSGVSSNNSDGAAPAGELVVADGILYGVTSAGGANGNGSIFRLNEDGSGFTNLHQFGSITYLFANHDGARPQAGLILGGGILYGTTELGGTNATGVVFAVSTNGGSLIDLYDFSLLAGAFNPFNHDGAQPHAAPALGQDTLYGNTFIGGTATVGTTFALQTNGTGFLATHQFTASSKFFPYTNFDGNQPVAALTYANGALYGTTPYGGTNGTGIIFKINSDGTGFTALHSFTGIALSSSNNSGGATPLAALLFTNDMLYGTTSSGGTNGSGTIFSLNLDGTRFTTLYSFTNGEDGANPRSPLAFGNGFLFGTTYAGGTNGDGAVFAMTPDGFNFLSVYSFTGGGDGANPNGVIFSSNVLYGCTSTGGTNGTGTVFRIDSHPLFFSGEASLGSNVYFLIFGDGNLFGYYNYNVFPNILYHYDLGFEYFYPATDGSADAYFYDYTSCHFWYISPDLFPYIFDFGLDSWIYYYADIHAADRYTSHPRYFFDFATQRIITQ